MRNLLPSVKFKQSFEGTLEKTLIPLKNRIKLDPRGFDLIQIKEVNRSHLFSVLDHYDNWSNMCRALTLFDSY